MADRVPDDKIDDLFARVDRDQSGDIDFGEFGILVQGIHPSALDDSAEAEESKGLFGFFG